MRSLLSLAVTLACVAYGQAVTYQRINGIVVECDDAGTPKTVVSVPANAERVPISVGEALSTASVSKIAKVMTPVTSYRTVCENGVCRTVAETSYVEVNSDPVPVPAATVWASPTVPLTASNSTCTTCNQSAGVMRTESGNPVAFPRAFQAVESFRANRPILFPRLHKLLHPNG